MRTSNRAHSKAGKKIESTQDGKPTESTSEKAPMPVGSSRRAEGEMIQPAQAVQEMIEALAAYRVRVNEAGSLALLFAARIRTGVKEHAEWSDFDRHLGFADGVRELALTALARLREQGDAYGIAYAGIVEALRGMTALVPLAPGDAPARPIVEGFHFEQSKEAMLDLLEMMGDALSERHGQCRCYSIADVIGQALEDSFQRVWRAGRQLREAALAVEWQRLGEQRAAA